MDDLTYYHLGLWPLALPRVPSVGSHSQQMYLHRLHKHTVNYPFRTRSNTSGKGAEAGKQANMSSSPLSCCSSSHSLAHTGLLSNPLYSPSAVEPRGRDVLLAAGWLEM